MINRGGITLNTIASFLGLLYEWDEVFRQTFGEAYYENKEIFTIFFNDITVAPRGKDTKHETHKTGDDIDIRYPSSVAKRSASKCNVCWNTIADKIGEQTLKNYTNAFLNIAHTWGFNQNYAYPATGLEYVKEVDAGTRDKHDNHLHIGRRRFKKLIFSNSATQRIKNFK